MTNCSRLVDAIANHYSITSAICQQQAHFSANKQNKMIETKYTARHREASYPGSRMIENNKRQHSTSLETPMKRSAAGSIAPAYDARCKTFANDPLNSASPTSGVLGNPQLAPLQLQTPSQPPLQQLQQQQQQQQTLSNDEQALILRLQDSYKLILSLESDLQQHCARLNLPSRLDMTELWDIYNLNIHLLNSYHDFVTHALQSGKSGKQIVTIYRIQRRLWVYGIVTFLDVLKNVVSIFIEHDICSSFIAYSFNILTSLTDLSINSWVYEKIGDLSRMAIALYPSRYIDWKLSSEYWYDCAMKLNYGQGKIYYHIATVQQDNLDALMNIGKAVFSRDTFIPTKQYMKMVIDNINQRQYVDLPVMDFIRMHKMLLDNETDPKTPKEDPPRLTDTELNNAIIFYLENLGKDSNGLIFFKDRRFHVEDFENKLQFWFQSSSSFAIINILEIVGFGNPLNPFAKIFGLVQLLREKKGKKEKKRLSPTPTSTSLSEDLRSSGTPSPTPETNWDLQFQNLNNHAVTLAMKFLQTYINGPLESSTPHIIAYLYFLIALGEASTIMPEAKRFIESFVQFTFPINSLVNFLNKLLILVQKEKGWWNDFKFSNEFYDTKQWLIHFNSNENLLEVWKLWGTLIYDKLFTKTEYQSYKSAGFKSDSSFIDLPIAGERLSPDLQKDRIFRILLASCYIAKNFNFGLACDANSFKVKITHSLASPTPLTPKVFSEPITSSNFLQTEPSKLPISAWLKQTHSTEPSIIPPSPTLTSTIYYTDNEADCENSSMSTPSLPLSTQLNLTSLPTSASSHQPSIQQIVQTAPATRQITVNSRFILDTNIWLSHPGRLYKCLISKSFKKISIPLVTFQELRSLRCSPDVTIADAATRAVITVRQLNYDRLLLGLGRCGNDKDVDDIREFEGDKSWRGSVDDVVIESCVKRMTSYRNLNDAADSSRLTPDACREDEIVVITDDKNMRLKCRTRGVLAFSGAWLWEWISRNSEGKCVD